MAYCTQCGNQVRDVDAFCAKCGARQASAPVPRTNFMDAITPRAASLACYIPMVGWIPCLIVLASAKFRDDREVRFHAFQGLYLFVVWLIVDWVVGPIAGLVHGAVFPVANLLKVGVIFAWVFMLVKLSQGHSCRLPIIGELAERSVAEQKP